MIDHGRRTLRQALIILFAVGSIHLWLGTPPAQAAEISVTPMLIELHPSPGKKAKFSFSLRSEEKTKVKLRIFDLAQQATGYMGFNEISAEKTGRNANPIELEKTSIQLPGKKPVQVKGQINLPRRVRGTQLFAVMVEEERPKDQRGGITINVRYAVVIKVDVKGRRYREVGKFDGLALVREKDGTLVLAGMLFNGSPQDYHVKSFAQIRDLDNKLDETVELRSKAAWQKKEKRSRIFPGARVRLLGPVRKVTQPGGYRVRVLNRLGKRGQTVTRTEMLFGPELLGGGTPPAPTLGPLVEVTPNPIPATLRRNNSSFSVFTLVNRGSETVTVHLPAAGASGDGSAAERFSFIPRKLQIPAGKKKRVVLKQQFSGQPRLGERIFQTTIQQAGGTPQPMAIRVLLGRKEG
ncbi:MAG: hypothetical protein V3S29_12920 [bacterium]